MTLSYENAATIPNVQGKFQFDQDLDETQVMGSTGFALEAHLNELRNTIAKRNNALKELRSMLSKTEEERDEYWKQLQLELREKRVTVEKLKDAEYQLDELKDRLNKSETARKSLSRTLSKFSAAGVSPITVHGPVVTVTAESTINYLKQKVAELSIRLEDEQYRSTELEKNLAEEEEKRRNLKQAIKGKVERFEFAKSEMESALDAERNGRELVQQRAEELLEISSRCEQIARQRTEERDELFNKLLALEAESEVTRKKIEELQNFKVQAMQHWMREDN